MNKENLEKHVRIALATATLAGALSGGCTKPENSPTPVRPTPDNPNPTPALVDKTPTPVRPTSTPTAEVKTPTPEATPTVIAINIPRSIGGPITEATPTPDIQREALTEKAKLYYEKNPLIVKGSQLNGILVSERTPENKILISVRTFTGTMENAVLAGNWGYFSANEKSEITGIVWAKQDTFTDSKGTIGYLGDSKIATAGAGFFGAEKVGYWTKDGKMIASLDPQTGNPVEIKPAVPTATPTPEKPKLTFTPYGVYYGEIKEGGKVLLVLLPIGNGQLFFYFDKQTPKCTFDYDAFSLFTKGTIGGDRFTTASVLSKSATGTLIDSDTVEGTITAKGYTASSPSGTVVCPSGNFSFVAKKIGLGKDILLETYRKMGTTTITKEQAQQKFESKCKCSLP